MVTIDVEMTSQIPMRGLRCIPWLNDHTHNNRDVYSFHTSLLGMGMKLNSNVI